MPRKNHLKPNPPQHARITGLSHEGRGIAHVDGKVTFISGTLPTEEVMFITTKQRGSYNEGKVVEILKPAANRAVPHCQHYAVCGGCSLQHLTPEAQIAAKQQILIEQLQHFGNISPQELLPALLGQHWEYRRKARLGVKYVIKKQSLFVGFREKDSRYLADLDYCPVLHPSIGTLLPALKHLIHSLEAYQHIAQIEVAVGDSQAALIFRHLIELSAEDLQALRLFGDDNQIHIYLQAGGPDTIQRLWPTTGPERLSYQLPEQDLELLFHPADFTQINSEINRQMVSLALALLQPNPPEKILDLFCGLGNFTLAIAKSGAQVTGIEGDAEMVKRGIENARHNHLGNVEFYCSNLAGDFYNEGWAQQQFDKVLLDPPRSGALEIIQHFPKLGNIQRIVYVSCNPATLARDAGELIKQGYVLSKAGVMDMFPHTTHVESIAVFDKIMR